MCNKEKLLDLYSRMTAIREFEELAKDLYSRGAIAGILHLSVGQEAVAAGVLAGDSRTATSFAPASWRSCRTASAAAAGSNTFFCCRAFPSNRDSDIRSSNTACKAAAFSPTISMNRLHSDSLTQASPSRLWAPWIAAS